MPAALKLSVQPCLCNHLGKLAAHYPDVYKRQGYGSVAERNFRSHVTCTRRMPDGRYVLSVDNGTDQVKVYRFNDKDKSCLLYTSPFPQP